MNKTLCFLAHLASLLLAALFATQLSRPVIAAGATPENPDNAFRRILGKGPTTTAVPNAGAKTASRPRRVDHGVIRDAQQRVHVIVHLDGRVTLADLKKQMAAAGASVTAESGQFRNGVISAFVPANKLAD